MYEKIARINLVLSPLLALATVLAHVFGLSETLGMRWIDLVLICLAIFGTCSFSYAIYDFQRRLHRAEMDWHPFKAVPAAKEISSQMAQESIKDGGPPHIWKGW